MIALEKARSCLETLGLLQASDVLDSRLQKAAADGATYADFLSDILGEEIAKRRQRNVEVKSKLAHFPFKRTLKEFDFDFQPSVDKKLISCAVDETEAARLILFLNQWSTHYQAKAQELSTALNSVLRMLNLLEDQELLHIDVET